jgi:hypothetical protein
MTALTGEGFERDVAEALLSADRAAAPDWLDPEGAFRFRLYRNNLRHGLAGSLAEAFPVVRRLVGVPFFEAAAGVFIERQPPRDRMLAAFGGAFADFLSAFEPAQSVPYLADVARLERARIEALHAADAGPLDPASLSDLGAQIVAARFTPHPACRLVQSSHPVLSIWQAQTAPQPSSVPLREGPEAVLITRPDLELQMVRLSMAGAAFAATLLQGNSAEDADAAASALDSCFDPTPAFRTLLDAGAFRALRDDRHYQTNLNQGSGS